MRKSLVGWTLLAGAATTVAACGFDSAPAGNSGPTNPFGSGGSAGSGNTTMSGASTGGDLSSAGAMVTAGSNGGGSDPSIGGNAGGGSGGATSGGSTGGVGGSAVAGTAGSGGGGGSGGGVRVPPTPDGRGIYGHPDPATDYPKIGEFTPYLVEEFNSPIDLDSDPIWTWSDTALGDGAARMVKDNITFEGGNMVLKVSQQEVKGGYSFAAADNVGTRQLASGEFRSMYNNFRYGRYEVRMKAPSNASNYIFTMFAYRTPAYLNWREIDIEVQASPKNSFITNLITAEPGTRVWNGGIEESARDYPFGGDAAAQPIPGGFDTQAQFHTYAFEWLPTSVKWYIDGVLIRTKTDGVGKNKLPIPKLSTKIVMNIWIFPTKDLGGGDPALNVYPIAGQYDWFRFYKWTGDDTYPCANTPSCLPVDDLKLAKNNPNDGLPDIRPELCTGVEGMLDVACGP